MKSIVRRLGSFTVTMLAILLLATGTANALSVTWAFLFPIPLPLPVWSVEHPRSFVTIGFLFPVWLPLPFYDYGPKGPSEPRFHESNNVYIDGQYAGQLKDYQDTASVSKLPDGSHTFEIRDNDRKLYAASFEVKEGKVVLTEGVTR